MKLGHQGTKGWTPAATAPDRIQSLDLYQTHQVNTIRLIVKSRLDSADRHTDAAPLTNSRGRHISACQWVKSPSLCTHCEGFFSWVVLQSIKCHKWLWQKSSASGMFCLIKSPKEKKIFTLTQANWKLFGAKKKKRLMIIKLLWTLNLAILGTLYGFGIFWHNKSIPLLMLPTGSTCDPGKSRFSFIPPAQISQ